VGCNQRLRQALRRQTRPSGRKPGNGDFAGASTGGIGLLPLYSQNLLPKTVVSRPIRGTPPTVDLVIGYSEANTSPLLKFVLTKVDDLKFELQRVAADNPITLVAAQREDKFGNNPASLSKADICAIFTVSALPQERAHYANGLLAPFPVHRQAGLTGPVGAKPGSALTLGGV
jgi:hypothetical protein